MSGWPTCRTRAGSILSVPSSASDAHFASLLNEGTSGMGKLLVGPWAGRIAPAPCGLLPDVCCSENPAALTHHSLCRVHVRSEMAMSSCGEEYPRLGCCTRLTFSNSGRGAVITTCQPCICKVCTQRTES